MKRKFSLVFVGLVAALIVACAPVASQPTEEQPTDEPTTEGTEQPTEATPDAEDTSEPAEEMPGGEISHPAVLEAQVTLAEHLGVTMADLVLVSAEQVEWNDGCLGLGGPAESCLQVIVPGWRVIFSANGTEYEVRTDETGSNVRINSGEQLVDPNE